MKHILEKKVLVYGVIVRTFWMTLVLRGETGPDGQNIFGHTDVLIKDIFFVNANTCTF